MRLAVLSDIHSNIFALDAVLEDLERYHVDIKINLGDIFYGPISPKATYMRLQQHDFITICGNQDRQILEATSHEIAQNSTMQYILSDLGQKPIEWLKGLPSTLLLLDDIFLCHGTPYDDLVYLLEETQYGYVTRRKDEDIVALIQGINTPLILCGHSHLPKTIFLAQTGQTIVNSGSVGLQAYKDEEPYIHSIENGCTEASYSIVEKISEGWNIQHKRVAYDFEKASALAVKNGRSDWGYALKTGQVMPL